MAKVKRKRWVPKGEEAMLLRYPNGGMVTCLGTDCTKKFFSTDKKLVRLCENCKALGYWRYATAWS